MTNRAKTHCPQGHPLVEGNLRGGKRKHRECLTCHRERERARGIVQRDPCAYCGGPGGSVDHIVPVARGGEPGWANLSGACHPCNVRKNARPLLTFLQAVNNSGG